MSRPTMKMFKHAVHLAEYLMNTKDAFQVFRWTYPGRSCLDDRVLSRSEAIALQEQHKGDPDLIEAVSDSDWAGHFDRVNSSTCGHVYVNGGAVHCFVRKQGAISLSSCEAELIACCSTAAEAIYIKHIVQTHLACCADLTVQVLDRCCKRKEFQKFGIWTQNFCGSNGWPMRRKLSLQQSAHMSTRVI